MSSEIIWKYEKPNYEILLEKLEKLKKENEELKFKLLARERGEAEFEVLVDTLKKENTELKEDNSHQWEERCRLTFELERLQKENEELKAINSMQKYRIEVIDERELISKEKIREYIKENKRVYEMKTPNRNRVIYKDCVLLTREAKELLGE